MRSFFLTVNKNQSKMMMEMHQSGGRIISCKGGFNAEHKQGWTISYIPGDGAFAENFWDN